MKCPVCKTECKNNTVCPECGFSEIGKMFLNEDDAKQWVVTKVMPFRDRYYEDHVLTPLDWLEMFKQNSQAKRLIEYSIPTAIKRRSMLKLLNETTFEDYMEYLADATLEHVAVISSSQLVRKHFLDIIKKMYLDSVGYKRVVSACIENKNDLAAILCGLEHGETQVVEVNSKMKKSVASAFAAALKESHIEITLGKGKDVKKVGLELPCFTALFISDLIDNIPAEVLNAIKTVIELDFTEEELAEIQIREAAPIYAVQLTKANIETLVNYVVQLRLNNSKGIRNTLKHISEYLYLNQDVYQPLSKSEMYSAVNSVFKKTLNKESFSPDALDELQKRGFSTISDLYYISQEDLLSMRRKDCYRDIVLGMKGLGFDSWPSIVFSQENKQ